MSKNPENKAAEAEKPTKPVLSQEERDAANNAAAAKARADAFERHGKTGCLEDEIGTRYREVVNTDKGGKVNLEALEKVLNENAKSVPKAIESFSAMVAKPERPAGVTGKHGDYRPNTGRLTMTALNTLRGAWKRGVPVSIGGVVLHDKEAEKAQKAKDEAKKKADAERLAAVKDKAKKA